MTTFSIPDGTVTASQSGTFVASTAAEAKSHPTLDDDKIKAIADAAGVDPRYVVLLDGLSGTSLTFYTERILSVREIQQYTQHLTGRLKTLIDSSIADPEQRKAFKDLLHDMMWKEHFDAVVAWAAKVVKGELYYVGGLGTQSWEQVIEMRIARGATPEPYPFPFKPDQK